MGDREAANSFLCEIESNGQRLMRPYRLCPIDQHAGGEEERVCAS
jgi:hypothetical protein